MSSFYSSPNNNTTKQIYNIIDDLQNKLANRNKQKIIHLPKNRNYSNYNLDMTENSNAYYQRPQINSYRINEPYQGQMDTNQSQVIPQNLTFNQSVDMNNIRKMIKEEFNSLIVPIQNDLNNNINNMSLLQNKVDNVSNDLENEKVTLRNKPKNNINKDSLINEIKNMLNDYVPYTDYNKKIMELSGKISAINNDLNLKSNSIKNVEDKLNNETNDINQKIKTINDNFNDKLNKYINNNNSEILSLKESNSKLLLNEIKLNDIINKNDFLQKNFDMCKDEMTNYKKQMNLSLSSLTEKNQKINDLENKINTFNDLNNKINAFENIQKKLIEEMSQISNNFKNIESSVNNLEGNINKNNMNNNIKNDINNLNENQNKEIKDIKETLNKLNLNELQKIDVNKFNLINQNYEDSMLKNQEIFKILEQYDTTIKDLSTKLEILRNDYESQLKKKYEQINERISKVEDDSKEKLSARNSNTNNISNINEIQTIKGDINAINQKINNISNKMNEIEEKINSKSIKGSVNNFNNENEEIKNDILNIKDEIQNISNKVNDIMNMNQKPDIKDNDAFSQEIENIKKEIESLKGSVKKNNYMMQIATLNSQIEKIKRDIEFYHPQNQNNEEKEKRSIIINNKSVSDDKIDNKELSDDYEDSQKIINENNKRNGNQPMMDLLNSGNQEIEQKETFLTGSSLQKKPSNPFLDNNYSSNNDNNNLNNNSNNFSNNNNPSNNNFTNNFSNNKKNSFNLLQSNNENINNNENDNNNNDENVPIGDVPIPVYDENEEEDRSDDEFKDFEVEEI